MALLLVIYVWALLVAVAVPYFRYKYAPKRKNPVKFYKFPGAALSHRYAKNAAISCNCMLLLLPIFVLINIGDIYHFKSEYETAVYIGLALLLSTFVMIMGLEVYFLQKLKKKANQQLTGKELMLDVCKDMLFFSKLYIFLVALLVILDFMGLIVK